MRSVGSSSVLRSQRSIAPRHVPAASRREISRRAIQSGSRAGCGKGCATRSAGASSRRSVRMARPGARCRSRSRSHSSAARRRRVRLTAPIPSSGVSKVAPASTRSGRRRAHDRPRVVAARQGLEPLPRHTELGAHRRARQLGQLAHGRQPEQREALARGGVGRQQGQRQVAQRLARQGRGARPAHRGARSAPAGRRASPATGCRRSRSGRAAAPRHAPASRPGPRSAAPAPTSAPARSCRRAPRRRRPPRPAARGRRGRRACARRAADPPPARAARARRGRGGGSSLRHSPPGARAAPPPARAARPAPPRAGRCGGPRRTTGRAPPSRRPAPSDGARRPPAPAARRGRGRPSARRTDAARPARPPPPRPRHGRPARAPAPAVEPERARSEPSRSSARRSGAARSPRSRTSASMRPERPSQAAISMASAASRGRATRSHSRPTPRRAATAGSSVPSRSSQAVSPPAAWAAASVPSASVVAPLPGGASRSASAPRGQPPLPRAASSAGWPVGIDGRDASSGSGSLPRRRLRPRARSVSRAVARDGETAASVCIGPPMIEQMFYSGKPLLLYSPPARGDVAQLGEHRVRIAGVRGSSPLISTPSHLLRPDRRCRAPPATRDAGCTAAPRPRRLQLPESDDPPGNWIGLDSAVRSVYNDPPWQPVSPKPPFSKHSTCPMPSCATAAIR